MARNFWLYSEVWLATAIVVVIAIVLTVLEVLQKRRLLNDRTRGFEVEPITGESSVPQETKEKS